MDIKDFNGMMIYQEALEDLSDMMLQGKTVYTDDFEGVLDQYFNLVNYTDRDFYYRYYNGVFQMTIYKLPGEVWERL